MGGKNEKVRIPYLGILAVKNLLITKQELQKGIVHSAKAEDPDQALKEYLLSNELISSQNMDRLVKASKALEIRQKEFKFGAIAVKKGIINQSVLKLALEEQELDIKSKRKVRMIGDLLVDAGMMTTGQRDAILKLQNRARPEPDQTTLSPEQKEEVEPSSQVLPPETDLPAAPGKHPSEDIPLPVSEPDGTADESGGETTDSVGLIEPEIIDGGIRLEISNDHMSAYITKTESFNPNISLVELKEALLDRGIVMGIVENKKIEGFIDSSGFRSQPFMVAKGISPIRGKDAVVEFFFNTDYLKAGGVTEDGTIDFKDRGRVPHVEKGTVLAEKIPMVEARKGHSIFGDEIEIESGKDVTLRYGKGAKVSEDGYKILAAVKGFPKYSLSGHIFVHQEYATEGDVDYKTGHIDYDGNVNIKGRVKSGFKVKANDVQALEIDGGKIDAEGNVRVSGGINEGIIYSRGNVYAKFIQKSRIVCMGDVVVEKEIVDSDIECSGVCNTSGGKLISSRITAKMGVNAMNIGTETARPNLIKVAHDIFLEKELEKNKANVLTRKERRKEHEEKKQVIREENLSLQKQITDLAHIQDRSQLEQKDLVSKISVMEQEGGNEDRISELKIRISQLKQDAQNAEKELDDCFDKAEENERLLKDQDGKIQVLDEQCADFLEERKNLLEFAKENPGKAEVTVQGAIMPETIIRGRHSEKRITKLTRHARFQEVLCSAADGKSLNIYEIRTGQI